MNSRQMLNINIDENTNLDEISITYGTEQLVQGVDYKFITERTGNQVTVTMEFMGNFTGKDQATYTLSGNNGGLGNTSGKDDGDGSKGSGSDNGNMNEENAENNTDGTEGPKTGDTPLLFVWVAVAALSGVASIVAIKKRNYR